MTNKLATCTKAIQVNCIELVVNGCVMDLFLFVVSCYNLWLYHLAVTFHFLLTCVLFPSSVPVLLPWPHFLTLAFC